MTWPTYPVYRDSGVQWLGRIPEGWAARNPKTIFTLHRESAHDSDRQLTASQKRGVVYQDEYMESEGVKVVQVIEGQAGLKHVAAGDFVISLRSFQGGIEWCEKPGKISPAYTVLTPGSEIHDRYFVHLLKSDGFVQELRSTSNQLRDGQSLGLDHFSKVLVPLPPIGEQRRIADFLDRETARTDALIDRQNQLIATLREGRTATITHAVTEGLNPDAEMKDSGVRFLPPLPAHWQVRAVKHLGQLITGSTPATAELTNYAEGVEGFPWFRPEDLDTSGRPSVASRMLTVSGRATVPYFKSPAVLVVSIGATLGKIGYSEVDGSSNQQITAIVGASNAKFVYYALVASHSQIWASSMGNTLPIISAGRLGAVRLPIPPADEQNQLAAFLDDQCAKIDTLIKKATEVITVLGEYRSALITAAVTGKIDIRGAA